MPQTTLEFNQFLHIQERLYRARLVLGRCPVYLRFETTTIVTETFVIFPISIPLSMCTCRNGAGSQSLHFTYSLFQYHPVIGHLIAASCWQVHYLLCKRCVVGVSELRNVGQKYGCLSEPYNWPNKQKRYLFKFERFWRWYIIIDVTVILHSVHVHHPRVKTTTFQRLNLLPYSDGVGKQESLLWFIHRS